MKQKIFLLVASSIILIACNDNSRIASGNEKDTIDHTKTESATTASEVSECYVVAKSKDSVTLHLAITNDSIKGVMDYQLTGKDKNKGTLQGELRGDTIFADYTFMSEGKESVRQVAYLKKDNQLLEGYGDVEEKGGKMVFKNTGALNFGKGVVLQKVDCQEK